jgi:hypothetical protein
MAEYELTAREAAVNFFAGASGVGSPTFFTGSIMSLAARQGSSAVALAANQSPATALPQMTFSLALDLSSLPGLTTGKDPQGAFRAALADNLATACGVAASRIIILSVKAGSVAVNFVIAPSLDPAAPSPASVASTFIAAAANPASALYTGSITKAALATSVVQSTVAASRPAVSSSSSSTGRGIAPVGGASSTGGAASYGVSASTNIGAVSRSVFIGLVTAGAFVFVMLAIAFLIWFCGRHVRGRDPNSHRYDADAARFHGVDVDWDV